MKTLHKFKLLSDTMYIKHELIRRNLYEFTR